MMVRWTFLRIGGKNKPWVKMMIHHFPPNVTDRDPHDHPRPFVTFVLNGRYFDTEWEKLDPPLDLGHGDLQHYMISIEELRAGAVRYRPAEHMHITETDNAGAWTLVVMGPEERQWGFLRNDTWWPFKNYINRFGGVIRCETAETEHTKHMARDYKSTPPPPV